ncbi:hypothetical protein C1H46_026364 [Malus baccata]|uniref:Uncharacterized protein n=1 Tax=Malus baccata TaxID=106549 RepID=A0A540LNK2_MALBA|nr:hypothetical protein C1H46_026364 [Malus baccata]
MAIRPNCGRKARKILEIGRYKKITNQRLTLGTVLAFDCPLQKTIAKPFTSHKVVISPFSLPSLPSSF